MASGHVNRTNRPNTWLHRPTCKREERPCQLGAVHTWHEADITERDRDVRFDGDCVAKLDRPVQKGSVGFDHRFMLPFEGATASLAASDATLTPGKQRAAVAVDGRAAWQAASGSARLQ